MPRTSGVSFTTTVWCMRRRPRPRTVARCRWIWPKWLFTSVTLTVLPAAVSFFVAILVMGLSARDFGDRLAALGSDALRSRHTGESVHRRAHDVDRVARAIRLREHVADAGALEHGAHAAARDDAGTVSGRLHVHLRGAVLANRREIQRRVAQRHVHAVLAGLLHRLLDRDRHFTRLAVTEADAAVAVAHHGERGEAELLAALHGLGHAVDGHQLFDELVRRRHFFDSSHYCSWNLVRLRTRGRLRARLRRAPSRARGT